MYESPNGEYVRGYLASDTLNGGADVPLFDRNGVARVLAVGERLTLNFVSINNGVTTAVVTLYQDKNGGGSLDAGEELYRASLAVSAQNFVDAGELALAPVTSAGGKLRAVASAASVSTSIIVIGFITKT